MTHHSLKHLILLACLTAAPLLTGCGKSAPTAPDVAAEPAGPTPVRLQVHWDVVKVINDGDLVGAGEFEFKRGLNSARTFTSKTMSDGDRWEINKTEYYTGNEGDAFSVYFEASEWDTDLLGRNVPDSDMNKRNETDRFTIGSGAVGTHSITLGNDACKVQVLYVVSFVRLPAGATGSSPLMEVVP